MSPLQTRTRLWALPLPCNTVRAKDPSQRLLGRLSPGPFYNDVFANSQSLCSAGNASLDQSGYSLGQSYLVNLFTFDFGSTPTNFTLSVLTYASMFNYSMDRPATRNSMGTGESVGGSTGFQFILDGAFSVNPTDTDIFTGLTGIHTVRFTT